MDSTATRPAALRLAHDPTPTPTPRRLENADRQTRHLAATLHELTLTPGTDRAQALREAAEQDHNATLRAAARLLLKEDAHLGAGDGFGGYHWIDGRLRWVSDYDGRRLERDGIREADLLPGSVDIPVGSSIYTLHMANGWIRMDDGRGACGTCCGMAHRILISNAMPAPHRLGTVWHEVMHACFFEFSDFLPDEKTSVEQWCNVAEKGLALIDPLKFAEIAAFVTGERFGVPTKPDDQAPATPERFTFDAGRVKYPRHPKPELLPGVVKVPVGPVTFDLYRVAGAVFHPDGYACNGLTYPDQGAVFIDVTGGVGPRLTALWHELGHAMLSVYNTGERQRLGEEPICDAVGAFMAGITPEKHREIVRFITCEDLPERAAV